MRLTNRCFLSLALCFTLTLLLQPKAAMGGDAVLPPGCCKFFCDADFAPLDAALQARTFEIGASGLASFRSTKTSRTKTSRTRTVKATKSATPILTLMVPPSSRVWNFNYKARAVGSASTAVAVSTAPTSPAPVAYSYCNPHQAEPASVRSLKRQVAPMLFRDAGSWSEMTILIRLFAGEAATTIRTCTAPIEQLPSRVVRLVGDVIWLK